MRAAVLLLLLLPLALGCPCGPPLLCVHGRCLPPGLRLDTPCSLEHNHTCARGLHCAGPSWDKRCKRPVTARGVCKDDPYRLCASWLECRDGICQRPRADMNEPCALVKGFECKMGLVCAGRPTGRKCVKPMPVGGKCGKDPWWVCEPGKECRKGVCTHPRQGMNQKCAVKKGWECEKGLVCAGRKKGRKCVKPMPEGGKCGKDPWWVCEEGFRCVDGRCRKGKKVNRKCQRDWECKKGLRCAGREGGRKCVMPMPVGGKCETDPWWVCERGVECVDGKCRQGKRVNEKCEKNDAECKKGLRCAGREGGKKCVMPMPVGGKCETDPWWVCERGVACVNGICVT